MQINTTRKTFFSMLGFGFIMGCVFPLYASLFTVCKTGMSVYFISGCIVAGCSVGLASFGIARFIVFKKIKNITIALENIANGNCNLTQRIDAAHTDEIGLLSATFNMFVEKQQQMIKDLLVNSTPLFTAAENIAATTMDMATSSDDMASQANSVASTVAEASARVGNIAANADTMSQSVNTVASAIEEMSASLSEVSRNCQTESGIMTDANTRAKNMHETINALKVSAVEIGKIVNIINDIADRTNLLALNATIEAASAGESGKGFAVVATEVKELAKQTAQATNGIKQQIETMQSRAEAGVLVVSEIAKTIDDVNIISHTIVNSVEQQSAAVNEIARNTGNSGQVSLQIAEDVQHSAKGLSDIAVNIEKVSDAARQMATSTNGINDEIMQMTTYIANLQKVIKRFKV